MPILQRNKMRAMVLEKIGSPLVLRDVPKPTASAGEVQIQVKSCGICRTDLHVIDGELSSPKLPLILGHQIIGHISAIGSEVSHFQIGQRVGAPWLAGTCHTCAYCTQGQENLCAQAVYTGYQKNGGFAEFCVANADYCFPLPEGYSDKEAAPLMCAGLIGYRSLRFAGTGKRLGFYGFGSAAHLLTQVALSQGREVYAFTRPDDLEGQQFARSIGAIWAGSSEELPPVTLDAAILFAPVGSLSPQALKAIAKGGTVICAGIHMSDIPSFPYKLLWEERVIRSVANLTRDDAREFLALAAKNRLHTQVTAFPLEQANEALNALRHGATQGSLVLSI